MSVAGGERRVVSVLVADVAGSTAIAERLGPERSKHLLDEVVRLMRLEVERFGGTVAQLTGDGVLALFGAPIAHEDDSERAVRAALGIDDAVTGYAHEIGEAYDVELAARVGVNTGPVVIPESDVSDEDRYNALGDTVNVAARLQALAGRRGVTIGSSTARQVEGVLELEPLGEAELKGRSAPVRAYRVVGIREAEPATLEAPLVGREPELGALSAMLGLLVDGRGGIVVVTGEPGIGKSRLVEEVRRRYDQRVQFLEGHGVSYGETFPFWPVRELLRRWLGVGVSAPEARVRLELKAKLAPALGADADAAYPLLATVLGLSLEPDAAQRVRELSREAAQRATFDSAYDLVVALSRDRPLCLVLDDLHWADESTLELLEHLLPVTEEEAVAFVLAYRSERDHGSWQLGERARRRFPHRYSEVELSPLSDDASAALAENTSGAELPAALETRLVERSGGNPFFLEEALRDLLEQGALRREDGRLELAIPLDEIEIPTGVQEALQARLDRIASATRQVVSVASVVGRTFGLPLLERLLPRSQLVPALSELQRLDLVVEERRRPAAEYRFRHGLVQEAVYATLTEARRRELHAMVGRALEAEESAEETYGLLARHFSRADDPERAADYLLKAGDAARALYANEEALEHYEHALRFLDRLGDSGRARQTLFKVALAHHLAFDFERANAAYREAFARPRPAASRLQPNRRFETTGIVVDGPPAPGHTYSAQGWALVRNLFRGLLAVDRDLNVVPSLTEDLSVSGDGRSYTFALRSDARWSNGGPVTAHDFVFAWRRIREQGLVTAPLLDNIRIEEATDDRALVVSLHEPDNCFPYLLADASTFPWPRRHVEKLGEAWLEPENLVGNGPFLLTEIRDDGLRLTANPRWTGDRGNVGEAALELVASDSAAVFDAWIGGRYHVLRGGVPPGTDEPESIPEVVALLQTLYLGFLAQRDPLGDERVRKALVHAIDRDRVHRRCGRGVDEPATKGGFLPPAMPAHSTRVALGHDAGLASRLLGDAGYPGARGLPVIELANQLGDWGQSYAEELAAQWAEIGVRADVQRVPFDRALPPGAHAVLNGWRADYPDPAGVFTLLATADMYRDAEIDGLLERAHSSHDQGERNSLYRQLDRVWVADRAAVLPIHYSRTVARRRPWVEGYWVGPITESGYEEVVIRPELRP